MNSSCSPTQVILFHTHPSLLFPPSSVPITNTLVIPGLVDVVHLGCDRPQATSPLPSRAVWCGVAALLRSRATRSSGRSETLKVVLYSQESNKESNANIFGDDKVVRCQEFCRWMENFAISPLARHF